MIYNNLKRCLSLVLVFVMVLSMVPIPSFAEETETPETVVEAQTLEEPTETTETEAPTEPQAAETEAPTEVTEAPATEETEAPAQETEAPEAEPNTEVEKPTEATEPVETVNPKIESIQADIDALLIKYLSATVLSEEEIQNKVDEMSDAACEDAYWEILCVDENIMFAQQDSMVTDAELEELYNSNSAMVSFAALVQTRAEKTISPINLFATTVEALDGQLSITDSGSKGSLDGTTYTTSVAGSMLSKNTNTITISNNTANSATLEFDYSASSYNSLTIAGTTVSNNSRYSVLLSAGEIIEIKLQSKSGWGAGTATLTLSNLNLTAAAADSDVTIQFDSSKGSVTVDGTAITSEDTVNLTLATGGALVATANSGVTFLGWVNTETGKIESSAASFTFKPSANVTLEAVFVTTASDTAWFSASGGSYLFNDLNKASDYAVNATVKTVVLANNGTLASGNYTIDSGVTLLIPFNSSHTVYKSSPTGVNSDYAKPTAFRTLTMESGATITVNGEMSVSGQQSAKFGYNGQPTGPQGFVNMKEGSNITVTGSLYAWGYVVGKGSVTVSGAVYECFQVEDFRGGDATSKMTGSSNAGTKKVFPMSQYYVQNVEVPMTLQAGATEVGVFSADIRMAGVQYGPVPFIGENSLFKITSGSITKDYDEANDRLIIDVDGDLTISSMSISIKLAFLGSSVTIDSSEYVLPLVSNMSVDINSGTVSCSQDLALLPGVQISIAFGAKFVLGAGKSMHVYDYDQWGAYCGSTNARVMPLGYAYGRTAARKEPTTDASILVNGLLDASAGGLYTTSSGAKIYSTGSGQIITKAAAATTAYQASQDADKNVTYPEISITPAKLMHGDGTYLATASTEETITYNYSAHKRWVAGEHTNQPATQENVVNATCGADGSYNEVVYCSCGYKVSSTPKTIPATGEHVDTNPEDNLCDVCGTCITHTPDADDGDCTTPILCTVCKAVTTEAKTHAWDNNCDTTCNNDGCKVTRTITHTPEADDGNCTSAILCSVCKAVTTEAKTHVWENACDTTCNNTGCKVTRTITHSPENDDGDCTTAILCSICKAVTTPAAKNHTGGTATCTEQAKCEVCGTAYGDVSSNHTWSTKVTYTWSTDNSTCTASRACANDESHTPQTVTVESGKVVTNEPTCTEKGWTKYTATFTEDWANTQHKDVQDVAALGHTWGETTYVWSDNNTTCTATRVCSNKTGDSCTATATATITSETKAPTCTEKGTITYTAAFATEYADWTATQTKVVENAAALGHAWNEATYSWNEDKTTCTATRTCKNDPKHVETAEATVKLDTVDATCTENGSNTWTATFEADWARTKTETEVIPATGHVDTTVTIVDPTCSTAGSKTVTCACGHVVSKVEIPALNHSSVTEETKWENDDAKHWQVCPDCGEKVNEAEHSYVDGVCTSCSERCEHTWDDGVETIAPAIGQDGLMTYTCKTCGETKSEVIEKLSIKLYQRSLMLEELVCIKYKFTIDPAYSEAYIKENSGLLVWMEEDIFDGQIYKSGTETYRVKGLARNGSRYEADAKGVPAKKMGDTMYAVGYIINAEGEYEYSEVIDINPVKYAKLVMPRTESDFVRLRPVLVAMLNYGAAAQLNFNYKKDSLMNDWLTEEQQALAPYSSSYVEMLDKDASKYKFTPDIVLKNLTHPLVLNENVWIRFRFMLDSSVLSNATEVKLLYWSETQYNAIEECTLNNVSGTSVLTKNGSYYMADIEGIAAKRMGDTYYACVYAKYADGTEHYSAMDVFSIHYYASAVMGSNSYESTLQNLCKWIVAYSYHAKTYFSK